jgi:benzodiazapine receptor
MTKAIRKLSLSPFAHHTLTKLKNDPIADTFILDHAFTLFVWSSFRTMNVKNILKLIVSIVVCQLAGMIGALATSASIQTWYVTLNKPFFTPPNWLFAPVWLTLYTLMGISLFLVWRLGVQDPHAQIALALFGIQLLLNAFWSIAFFGLRSPLAGLSIILALWIAIAATIVKFLPLSKPAGLLLLPYILWVTIAAALNVAIVLLN